MNGKKMNIVIDFVFIFIVLLIIIVSSLLLKDEKKDTAESYDFQILEKDMEVSALYTDDEWVYVGTNNGIHIYDADTLELLYEIDNISMVYTASIVGDGENGVWVGHESGLTHIDREWNQINFEYPKIPKGRVNVVAIKDENVYCGTYHGAAVITKKDGTWSVARILTKEEGLLCDSVNVILPVEDGILYGSYMDTNGGITFISDSGQISYLDVSSGLPHPYITSAFKESNGNILLGTGYMRDGALVELAKNENCYTIENIYSTKDGLPGEKIRYIFEDEFSVWITTEYDGVLIKPKLGDENWIENREIYLTQESGLSDNEIKCIVRAKDYYWLGRKYGLTIVPKTILE